ncbi:MAG: hypothetical protein Q8Q09_27855 [Deltaproteobacteria bacterium]|nr:hypothetical protein [Deltaproteobacteria bacterium]
MAAPAPKLVAPPPVSESATRDKSSLLHPTTTRALVDVAATASRLREEQIQAKVVYYGAPQETNKDLDAITEAVVAELQALQLAGVRIVHQAPEPTVDLSIQLIATMRDLLEKLFSPRREGFMARKLEDIQRKITAQFFNSALYTKITTQVRQSLSVTYPDQALYIAMRMHRDAIVATLRAQRYADPKVLTDALARFDVIEKDLRMEYLSRTTPELEALLAIYREVLLKFFYEEFRPSLGDFCWAVITQSRVGEGRPHGYKLAPEVFSAFRAAFDKHFIERLVMNVQGPLVQRTSEMRATFREETLEFVADPQIFSAICTVVCDAIYDYLYTEGFLDLPTHWREHFLRDRGL